MQHSPLGLRQSAWIFAVRKHNGQLYKDTGLPFIIHVGMVLLEVMAALEKEEGLDAEFAICCALLHDLLEHTDTNFEDVESLFGSSVAKGVLALSKNSALPEEEEIPDSLARIRTEPREVWVVKLADRISGLENIPASWSREKRLAYCRDAQNILDTLGEASPYLADRLAGRIGAWERN